MDDGANGLAYLVLLLLVAFSAFFSASETAYSAVNKIRLKNYADAGNKRARRALTVVENFDKMLSTILVGNNVVNMSSASLATVLVTAVWGPSGAAVATGIMTVIILIFGEILPKTLAKENCEPIAMFASGPLSFLMKLMTPVVFIFVKIKAVALRLLNSQQDQPTVTEDELKYIVESIEQEGVLEEQESDLVRSALDFDEITVQEILTPRVDLVALPEEEGLQEALDQVIDTHFSRIPVYRGTVDNIVGVLQVRDLMTAVLRKNQTALPALLTKCVYVHKTMKISELLSQLQAKRLHLAVVTDDYGGTMGIVTMEDVLEQLVGDIWDETDEVEPELVQTGENRWMVSGDMSIFSLFEELEIDDRNFESDYNTVGGWATEMLEHIPATGESFTYQNLKVTVTQMEEQRILALEVERLPEPAEGDEGRKKQD